MKAPKASSPSSVPGERIAKVLARAGLCSRRDAERWIAEGPGSPCQRLVQGACRKAGFEPNLQLTGTTDYRIAEALVAAGIGIAFIPRLAQQPEPAVAYLTPEHPVGRTIAVAYRTGGRRSRAVATMIDILNETASTFSCRPPYDCAQPSATSTPTQQA